MSANPCLPDGNTIITDGQQHGMIRQDMIINSIHTSVDGIESQVNNYAAENCVIELFSTFPQHLVITVGLLALHTLCSERVQQDGCQYVAEPK